MLTATLKKKAVQVLFKGKRWVIFKKYDSIFWKSLCLEAQQLWLPDCVAAQVSQGLYSFVVKYTIKLDFKYTIKLEMEEGGNPYCVASSSSLPSPAPSPSNKKSIPQHFSDDNIEYRLARDGSKWNKHD